MIRSTLTAVPTRLPVLFAKALVFGAATFAVSAVAFAVAAPVSAMMLAGNGIEVRLDDAQYWSALLGGVGYLTLVGLIAFAIGALLRSTAGGIAVALGLVLAAPLAFGVMPGFIQSAWAENLGMMLPSTAGSVLYRYPTEHLSAPETGSGWVTEPLHGGVVLAVWLVVLMAFAALLLKRRDA